MILWVQFYLLCFEITKTFHLGGIGLLTNQIEREISGITHFNILNG